MFGILEGSFGPSIIRGNMKHGSQLGTALLEMLELQKDNGVNAESKKQVWRGYKNVDRSSLFETFMAS